MKVRGRRPWLLSHIHTPGGGREHQIHSCGRLKKLQHHTSVWGAGLLKLVAPLISPYSNSEIKGELLSDGERETLLLHTFFFPSPSMYSSVTPQITPHYFTPLYFTSFSPIYIPLSPGSLSSSSPHPSLPPSLSGERRTWIVNLGVMELWQADPSALSPGHAAVPWLCDAYLPKHTSMQKLAGIHPPTHMHAYIYRATEGAHMCTYLHLHILIEHMCMCACAALYKWSHFCAGPRMCGRNKECQVLGNHRLEDFSGPIPISILRFDGFFCRFMCVCAAAAKVCRQNLASTENKFCRVKYNPAFGAPFSSVGRAGVPCTEALSSLQRPEVRVPAWGPLLRVTPPLTPWFLLSLELFSE